MTATETITSNERVQGLDPCLDESLKKGGIGEEDLVVLTQKFFIGEVKKKHQKLVLMENFN